MERSVGVGGGGRWEGGCEVEGSEGVESEGVMRGKCVLGGGGGGS